MIPFYTYMYLRHDGTPYYIGKAASHKRVFSKMHHAAVPKDKARIFIQCWESEKEALRVEKWYISLFGRKDLGTGILRNLTDGGEIGPTGAKHSKETKEKMSLAAKGKLKSEEHRKNMALAQTGRRHTEETKKKIRDLKTGIKQSPETIAKRVEARLGYRHSEETIRKIRESNRHPHKRRVAMVVESEESWGKESS